MEHKLMTVDINNERKTIAFARGDLWFFFNFNPSESFADLKFDALQGQYELILSSDSAIFGGFENIRTPQTFYAIEEKNNGCASPKISIYLPPRSAIVLSRKNKS
jgi:1,4-alpha-glucan branching enzyme